MDDQRKPWMKFFPADWIGDERLRLCSLAARGLWVDLMCLMHKGEPYGHLLVNGLTPNNKQLSRMLGASATEIHARLKELRDAGVFSLTDFSVIYSRRMVRDGERQAKLHEQGKLGGNPNLKPKTKPKDKSALNPRPQPEDIQQGFPQRPEARYSEANASGGDAVKPMSIYDTGEAMLLEAGTFTNPSSARGFIAKQIKAFSEAAVQAAIEGMRGRPPPADPKSALISACQRYGKTNGQHRANRHADPDIGDRLRAFTAGGMAGAPPDPGWPDE
jgi:DNA-binding Lrp family transcriptional regulator